MRSKSADDAEEMREASEEVDPGGGGRFGATLATETGSSSDSESLERVPSPGEVLPLIKRNTSEKN